MHNEQLITEARAKIIWGEDAESVRDFLTSNGMPGPQADEQIKTFNLERYQEIRKKGVKNTLIGAVVTIVSGSLIYLLLAQPVGSHWSTATGKILGLLMLAAGFGFFKLTNGIIYLVRPQSEQKSITELSD